MKEISEGDLIRIEYIEYNRKWDGYIFEGTPRLSRDEIPEEEEGEYNLIVWNSAEEDEFYVDRKYIMIRCVKNEALYSGWGYVEPAAGNGLEDCGSEPDYHFEDNLAPVWNNDVYLHGEGYIKKE